MDPESFLVPLSCKAQSRFEQIPEESGNLVLFPVDWLLGSLREEIGQDFTKSSQISACCSMESMRAVLSKLLLKTLYSATWSFYIDETISTCKVIIYFQYL